MAARVRIYGVITLAIGVLALGAAVLSWRSARRANRLAERAIRVSEDSNETAKKALAASREQFLKENRPYVVLAPQKFEDSQEFYRYELIPDRKAVKVSVQYRIENIGRAAARDIEVFRELKVGEGPSKARRIAFAPPRRITLGPREEYTMAVELVIGLKGKAAYDDYVRKLMSQAGTWVHVQVSALYSSEVEASERFKTKVAHRIYKRRAIVLKSDFERVDKAFSER